MKGKVADLKRKLQTAELPVRQQLSMDFGEEKKGDPALGPTISTKVVLEGKPMKALVDTGSPVTIVSIDSLLETLLVSCITEQSPEDWCKEVSLRIQPPSLTICIYGGGEINVIGQLAISLTLDDRKCQATVLVQKGASVGLLLGTNTLPWS